MSLKKSACGPTEEVLHVSQMQTPTCAGRLCPHGKCRKDGFVLIDATPEDVDEIKDEEELTEKIWKEVSPRKMSFKEEELVASLAIERVRTSLNEDPGKFADNLNKYNYINQDDYGKTIESTINVQKYRDGRIKKTVQQSVTEFFPPQCGIHKNPCAAKNACGPKRANPCGRCG